MGLSNMIKLFIKLNDDNATFEIILKKGDKISARLKGSHKKDLADKLIAGLDKIFSRAKLKKSDNFRIYLLSGAGSFVSNLIGNSITETLNWAHKTGSKKKVFL